MTKTTVIFDFGNGPVEIEGTIGVYKDIILKDNEFSTDPGWWRIKHENGLYIFSCLLGTLAESELVVEITPEENDKLRNGQITPEEICRKYKTY